MSEDQNKTKTLFERFKTSINYKIIIIETKEIK